jgi:hypothetical protein
MLAARDPELARAYEMDGAGTPEPAAERKGR